MQAFRQGGFNISRSCDSRKAAIRLWKGFPPGWPRRDHNCEATINKHPKVFRRNYFIGSVGEANCRVFDQYIAGQTSKHPMADAAVQSRIEGLQFHDETVDLGQTMTGNYGRFVYGLQVVVENEGGWNEIRESVLEDSRGMIIRAAAKKRWRLSRIGLLSNHLHVLLGVGVTESPASVALSLMNNLAYAQEMKPVFRYSYYVGTFGPYDLGAVRRGL